MENMTGKWRIEIQVAPCYDSANVMLETCATTFQRARWLVWLPRHRVRVTSLMRMCGVRACFWSRSRKLLSSSSSSFVRKLNYVCSVRVWLNGHVAHISIGCTCSRRWAHSNFTRVDLVSNTRSSSPFAHARQHTDMLHGVALGYKIMMHIWERNPTRKVVAHRTANTCFDMECDDAFSGRGEMFSVCARDLCAHAFVDRSFPSIWSLSAKQSWTHISYIHFP